MGIKVVGVSVHGNILFVNKPLRVKRDDSSAIDECFMRAIKIFQSKGFWFDPHETYLFIGF